ncbi:MAG TPA: hypothetical protein VNY36_05495 [Bacteroidia bacterium]|jgi:hypothetical protein|nr:hypothetical protein [Bacteroidia bacterium]
MTASGRNKEVYDFLIWVSDNPLETKSIVDDIEKTKEILNKAVNSGDTPASDDINTMRKGLNRYQLSLRLNNLGYIKVVPASHGIDEFLSVTEQGWGFCKEYEESIERRLTNKLLIIIGIPAFLYYCIELLKSIGFSGHHYHY